jgi:hypothetical protein
MEQFGPAQGKKKKVKSAVYRTKKFASETSWRIFYAIFEGNRHGALGKFAGLLHRAPQAAPGSSRRSARHRSWTNLTGCQIFVTIIDRIHAFELTAFVEKHPTPRLYCRVIVEDAESKFFSKFRATSFEAGAFFATPVLFHLTPLNDWLFRFRIL